MFKPKAIKRFALVTQADLSDQVKILLFTENITEQVTDNIFVSFQVVFKDIG